MAIYDGQISLGEERVHVILGIQEEKVTLSSNGREIGIWGPDEISIRYIGSGRYAISAEEETLEFVPNDQDSFAIEFGEIDDVQTVTEPDRLNGRHSRGTMGDPDESDDAGVEPAPPPKPLTRVAFYSLAAVTSMLGIWAIVSIIIG